ncbi:MAG: hypothetical protein J5945_04855 [Candidatus Methanomethylophilus sp.]|nr:hypothetical protein [Methanomethylophilus sp.]
MAEDGIGKNLLSERRVGPEKALRAFYDAVVENCPESEVQYTERIPDNPAPGSIIFVQGHRGLEGFDDWVSSLSDDIVVICAQELCHQVSAVIRVH